MIWIDQNPQKTAQVDSALQKYSERKIADARVVRAKD
jgi:hypothetical protein